MTNPIYFIKNAEGKVQEIRGEVGGEYYSEQKEKALDAMRKGDVSEAVAHKLVGLHASKLNYQEESPLSRLKRIREGQARKTAERTP